MGLGFRDLAPCSHCFWKKKNLTLYLFLVTWLFFSLPIPSMWFFFLYFCHPPFDKLFFSPLTFHSLPMTLCFFNHFQSLSGFYHEDSSSMTLFYFPFASHSLIVIFFSLTSHSMSVSTWKLKTYSLFLDLTNLEDNETIKGGKQCVFFENNQNFEKIPKNACTSNLKIWT